MTTSVISHQTDWDALCAEPPEVQARWINGRLCALDRAEKEIFAERGRLGLRFEEDQLYRLIVDEEVGECFTSFDRYLKQTLPNSWAEVRKAMAAVRELKDVPFDDLKQMKRCNVEQLRRTSSNVRTQPEVIAAAKTLPERELVEKLNQRFDQHLECKAPIVMAPAGDVAEFEAAIQLAMELEECRTRQEAIKCISVDYLESHRIELEYRKMQAEGAKA